MPYRQYESKTSLCEAFQVDGSCGQPGLDGDVFKASSGGAIEAVAGFGFTVNAFHPETVGVIGGAVAGQFFQIPAPGAKQCAMAVLNDNGARFTGFGQAVT